MTYTTEVVSATKIMVPVKVIDKRRKSGWLWDSFTITFRSLDPAFKNRGESTVFDLKANQQNYYDLDVGDIIRVAFYKHKDGKWYQYRE